MTLPNFILLGAAKSGTSSVWHYLKQHPQIFMSNPKEPFAVITLTLAPIATEFPGAPFNSICNQWLSFPRLRYSKTLYLLYLVNSAISFFFLCRFSYQDIF